MSFIWVVLTVMLLVELVSEVPFYDGAAFFILLLMFLWGAVFLLWFSLTRLRFPGWHPLLFFVVSGGAVGLNMFSQWKSPMTVDDVCGMAASCSVQACQLSGLEGVDVAMVKDDGHIKRFVVTRGWFSTHLTLYGSAGKYKIAYGKFEYVEGARDDSVIGCTVP